MFRENAKHLELASTCVDALVERARLVMLDDHPGEPEHPALDEAEASILKALELDRDNPEALEEAAHFYDVVVPNREKAINYAQRYVEVAGKVVQNMHAIIEDSN